MLEKGTMAIFELMSEKDTTAISVLPFRPYRARECHGVFAQQIRVPVPRHTASQVSGTLASIRCEPVPTSPSTKHFSDILSLCMSTLGLHGLIYYLRYLIPRSVLPHVRAHTVCMLNRTEHVRNSFPINVVSRSCCNILGARWLSVRICKNSLAQLR
jgi:hypothetical protein